MRALPVSQHSQQQHEHGDHGVRSRPPPCHCIGMARRAGVPHACSSRVTLITVSSYLAKIDKIVRLLLGVPMNGATVGASATHGPSVVSSREHVGAREVKDVALTPRALKGGALAGSGSPLRSLLQHPYHVR